MSFESVIYVLLYMLWIARCILEVEFFLYVVHRMFALKHGQYPYLLKIVFVYIFWDIFYMLRTYVCVRLLNVRKTYITTICVVVF